MNSDVAADLARLVPELDHDWRSAHDDPDLPHVNLGFLAGRMVELDKRVPRPNWVPLFADVERRLAIADPATRELLIVGFLEGLQNFAGHHGGETAKWEPFLGPLSREAWNALNAMWGAKMSPKRWNEFVARDIRPR